MKTLFGLFSKKVTQDQNQNQNQNQNQYEYEYGYEYLKQYQLDEALLEAALYGDVKKIDALVRYGANINMNTSSTMDITGNTPLHIAAERGNTETVIKLLKLGAAIEARNKYGFTPLHSAAGSENTETVTKLLELGAAIGVKDNDGNTLLHIAAESGNTETVIKLLELGAAIEAKTNDGNTPLHIAAGRGKTETVIKLLKLGAAIEARNKYGFTPLHSAAYYGHTETATKLFILGANIEAKDIYGNTPLHKAAERGSISTVTKLLVLEADREAKTNDELTPLHTAAYNGHTEIVTKLLILRANIKAKAKDGCTPLHMAAKGGRAIDTVAKLIELGADREAKTNDGRTPLHMAAESGAIDTVAKLVELGADREAKTNDGRTPLHMAAGKENRETVAKLLAIGADVDAKDNNGNTPLFYAEKVGNIDVIKLLQQCSETKKIILTPVNLGSVFLRMAKESQPEVTISEASVEGATEAVLAKQNKSEVEILPQLLQETELDPPKVAILALEQSVQLQNNQGAAEEASSLINSSSLKHSLEFKNPVLMTLPQPELPGVAEETYSISSSSQLSERALLSQADITSLKMNALLSLQEQQNKLAVEIQKLQELTQTMHPASTGKLISLSDEQEVALNKLTYKQAQLKALEQLKASPNLGEFYQTFVINIEALFLAIKTAQTNLMKIELQGTSGKAAQVTKALDSFLEAIPVIGNTVKSVSSVATKLLKKFDEHLIAQKLKQLHELGTQKQWQVFILDLAKFLTLRYEDQLVRLLPISTETIPESPARALANYVVMSFFAHLMSYPITMTTFLNGSSSITLTFEKVKEEFLEKLAPRAQNMLTKLEETLLTFLSKDTVISSSGKKISLQAILTKPGIRIGDAGFFDHDADELTNAAEYGYRLGTEQEALQYKLIKSTNKAPHLSATKQGVSVSSLTPPPPAPEQKNQEVRVSVEEVSAALTKDASNQEPKHVQAITQLLLEALEKANQRIEALEKANQEKDKETKQCLETLEKANHEKDKEIKQCLEALEKANQRLETLEKAYQEKDKEIKELKQQTQPSQSSWTGRVYDVPVGGNQLSIQQQPFQNGPDNLASPQAQAQKFAIVDGRLSYLEQEMSNVKEEKNKDVTAKMPMGIHTSSAVIIQKTTAHFSQKGTGPSK